LATVYIEYIISGKELMKNV